MIYVSCMSTTIKNEGFLQANQARTCSTTASMANWISWDPPTATGETNQTIFGPADQLWFKNPGETVFRVALH